MNVFFRFFSFFDDCNTRVSFLSFWPGFEKIQFLRKNIGQLIVHKNDRYRTKNPKEGETYSFDTKKIVKVENNTEQRAKKPREFFVKSPRHISQHSQWLKLHTHKTMHIHPYIYENICMYPAIYKRCE